MHDAVDLHTFGWMLKIIQLEEDKYRTCVCVSLSHSLCAAFCLCVRVVVCEGSFWIAIESKAPTYYILSAFVTVYLWRRIMLEIEFSCSLCDNSIYTYTKMPAYSKSFKHITLHLCWMRRFFHSVATYIWWRWLRINYRGVVSVHTRIEKQIEIKSTEPIIKLCIDCVETFVT